MRTFFSILLSCCAVSAFGQWSGSPAVNTPVSIAADTQEQPRLVSDGAGGTIVTWLDWRNSATRGADIYAQRIGANGLVQWTTNGIPVCGAAGTQLIPKIVSDGSGGAIIVWEDFRNGPTKDIYAQRINSSGIAQWTANGIPVCTAAGAQSIPEIASDGAGGAIITWEDQRAGSVRTVYAQRITGAGAAQWPADGVLLCATVTATPEIIADGSGGAIVVWTDNRTNTYTDLYAQRINASGVVKWTANGIGIVVMPRAQVSPSIMPDGAGGAIIAWSDQRSNGPDDIYAQRVDSSGNRLWAADGAPICTVVGAQLGPIVLALKDGGAIITWNDERNGNIDIYAQRVGSSGAAVWPTDGIPVCTAVNGQDWAQLTSDGNGGAIISWEDERAGGSNRHVYAQRVSASGAVQWAANGVAISTAAGYKSFSEIIPAGTGDGIIVWGDQRSGSNDQNIFAQRIQANGTLTSVRPDGGTPASYALEQNYPNPFNPSTSISFSLPSRSFVSLKVFDVMGREAATLVSEELSAGTHKRLWNADGAPSGVYFYRLQAGSFSDVKRVLLLK